MGIEDPRLIVPRLLDCSFFADENISRQVIERLRTDDVEVESAVEESLAGSTDRELLRHAFRQNQVVLTHDSDFGTLAMRDGEPLVGIVFIRPGSLRSHEVVSLLTLANEEVRAFTIPFLLVLEQRGESVRIRLRSDFA